MCCGTKTEEIVPRTVDASLEKHAPVFTVEGNVVKVFVGSVSHPIGEDHYIEWISIQTKQGNQRKVLKPNDAPTACFALCEDDAVEAVYAYCNLYGLWQSK